jgi:hypothetical protein
MKNMKHVTIIICATLGLALCATFFYALHLGAGFVRGIKSGADDTGDFIVGLAEGFQKENITETFRQELQTINGTGQGNLEVALVTSTEYFRRRSSQTAVWDLIDLGTTTTTIRVPATYRYHIKLSDEWKLDTEGQTVFVTAPVLRPSLPVAFDTGGMYKSIDEGWARFKGYEQMAQLERNISFTLNRNAKHNKNLAREESRKTVERFVKHWLKRNDQWSEDGFTNVEVIFADEPKPKIQTY